MAGPSADAAAPCIPWGLSGILTWQPGAQHIEAGNSGAHSRPFCPHALGDKDRLALCMGTHPGSDPPWSKPSQKTLPGPSARLGAPGSLAFAALSPPETVGPPARVPYAGRRAHSPAVAWKAREFFCSLGCHR